MRKFALINLFFCLSVTSICGQDINRSVQEVDKVLRSFSLDTVGSVYDLQLAKEKVTLRQKMVYKLEEKIDKVNYEIAVNIASQKDIEDKIELTRQELEKLLLIGYKNLDFYSQFGFVFSAEDFSQAFKRFLFLHELSAFRKFQIEMLAEYKNEVMKHDSTVFGLRNSQRELVALKLEQKDRLEKAIRKRQKAQRIILRKNTQFSEALNADKRMQSLINERAIEGITLYRTRMGTDRPLIFSQHSGANRKFFKQKGKLPTPVDESIVVSFFGKQKHPILDNVMIKNDGLTYRTPIAAPVKAVHEGVVTKVFQIAGAKYTVMLAHGNYFTLYANLEDVEVLENQTVKLGQALGHCAIVRGYGLLKFQIWKDKQCFDPSDWLGAYLK